MISNTILAGALIVGKLTRGKIIQTIVDALEPLDYVYAFYEGGAAAFARIDKWSDLDLYVVAKAAKQKEAFSVVEKALESISPIAQEYEVTGQPWPGVSQAFYKLKKASEYLIVDLAVLNLNSPEKFLVPEIHGNVIFHINKSGRLRIPKLKKIAFLKKIENRMERLQARFDMFSSFVQKEINRGNYLEALDLYYSLILASLIEVLRIEHGPLHYDFRMRYVYHELPSEVIKELERLYSVKDVSDLQNKYLEATKWFHKLMSEVDLVEITQTLDTISRETSKRV